MAQVKKTVTDAIANVPVAAPDKLRVIEALIYSNGHLVSNQSSWMLFGSKDLIKNNIIVSSDGVLSYGAFFEEYLISQNLASLHLAFCKQKWAEDVNGEAYSELAEEAFSADSFKKTFDSSTVSDKISTLANHVEFLLKENAALSEAYAMLEELVDRHITESD